VKRGRCVIEITVTWSLILPTPAEMRVSGSENFQNWRRIDFLFLQNQKIGRPVGLFLPGSENRAAVRIPQQDGAVRAFNKLARTFAAQVGRSSDTGAAVGKRCHLALREARHLLSPSNISARQLFFSGRSPRLAEGQKSECASREARNGRDWVR